MQKAQQLMDQVRAEAARMVDKTEIVRQSRLMAEQIVADAHAQARQMINQSEDFIDGKLGSFEIVLERLLKTDPLGSRAPERPGSADVADRRARADEQLRGIRAGLQASRPTRGRRRPSSTRTPSNDVASPYLVPVAQLLRDVPSTHRGRLRGALRRAPRVRAARTRRDRRRFPRPPSTVALRARRASAGDCARRVAVEAPWHGVCRRCSTPVLGVRDVAVDERFVDERGPGDEEPTSIENDFVDLAPLVHDAIFLDLPLAPLCREDCQGLCPYCGIDRNEATLRLPGADRPALGYT